MDLYNLQIVGEKVHVISQNGEVFKCYYPEKISFPLEGSETVELLTDDRVYIEKWIEEGWDEENNCATDEYKLTKEVCNFEAPFDEKFRDMMLYSRRLYEEYDHDRKAVAMTIKDSPYAWAGFRAIGNEKDITDIKAAVKSRNRFLTAALIYKTKLWKEELQ